MGPTELGRLGCRALGSSLEGVLLASKRRLGDQAGAAGRSHAGLAIDSLRALPPPPAGSC